VAFGHWSTLGPLQRTNLLALDTGCVWGGCLSALRFSERGTALAAPKPLVGALFQVACQAAQRPA